MSRCIELKAFYLYNTLRGIWGGEEMKEQSAENHARYFPLQHFIWLPLGAVLVISTVVYGIYRIVKSGFTFDIVLLFGALIIAIISGMLARIYGVKLQDRIIRTEERLRYYMLTQERMDESFTIEQLLALRFAPDEEYVALAKRALKENLSLDDIKQEIKVWRADHNRI